VHAEMSTDIVILPSTEWSGTSLPFTNRKKFKETSLASLDNDPEDSYGLSR